MYKIENKINKQSSVKTLQNFKQNTLIFMKFPMKNVGDLKRAENPSFPKGKLGHVHPQNVTQHSHSLNN